MVQVDNLRGKAPAPVIVVDVAKEDREDMAVYDRGGREK